MWSAEFPVAFSALSVYALCKVACLLIVSYLCIVIVALFYVERLLAYLWRAEAGSREFPWPAPPAVESWPLLAFTVLCLMISLESGYAYWWYFCLSSWLCCNIWTSITLDMFPNEQLLKILNGWARTRLKYRSVVKNWVTLCRRFILLLDSLSFMNPSILPFSRSFRVMEKFASLRMISPEFISVTEIVPSSEQAMRWPPESRVTAWVAYPPTPRALYSASFGYLPLLADEYAI